MAELKCVKDFPYTFTLHEDGNLMVSTFIPTPAIDLLYPYLDPETPLMPEGSKEIPLRWGSLLVWLFGLVSIIPLLFRFARRKDGDAKEK